MNLGAQRSCDFAIGQDLLFENPFSRSKLDISMQEEFKNEWQKEQQIIDEREQGEIIHMQALNQKASDSSFTNDI